MSVGEWLNSIIQTNDDADADFDRQENLERRRGRRRAERQESRPGLLDDGPLPQRRRDANRHRRGRFDADAPPLRNEGGPYRDEWRGDREAPRRSRDDQHRDREDRVRDGGGRDYEREAARDREEIRAAAREGGFRQPAHDGLGEVLERLDKLSRQVEHFAREEAAGPPLAMRQGQSMQAPHEPAEEPDRGMTGAPPQRRRLMPAPALSIEDAVAEIAARQRVLDGEPLAQRPINVAQTAAASFGTPVAAPDLSGLEKQLRQITSRIEALRPGSEIEKAIAAVRVDLTELGRQLTEALPRHAVESLEIEVKALAERIDHSRHGGADSTVLAALERGLAEVREALGGLTTAESLVGFGEAVKALAQKVDLIIGKEDPAALQQLEAAIGGLRGIVSHVASNDTLAKVAEDVRALAAKVDGLATSAASGRELSALQNRIDTLSAALTASAEAGHAVPRELEKLLAGLIEKLEWVQLTHTDHAALAHLEDRIATLVKRFDASDARLGHLEAIERGLADLLVHLEEMRGVNGRGEGGVKLTPRAVDAIEREVAEIKQNERRTQDSLEAVQGTVEDVVGRLATIESDLRGDAEDRAAPAAPAAQLPATAQEPGPAPAQPASAHEPPRAATEPAAPRTAAARPPRPPIDPSLPPNHPLEPGSAAGRARPSASAAERIAASQAAIDAAKPPVIPDPERPNFIAAARRAAQAAVWAQPGQQARGGAETERHEAQPNKLSQRLRKLIVAGGAVLIFVGCLHIALRLFADGSSGALQEQSEKASPPPSSTMQAPAAPASLPLPNPTPDAPPNAAPDTTKGGKPGRQSVLPPDDAEAIVLPAGPRPGDNGPAAAGMPSWSLQDITGALPRRADTPNPALVPPPTALAAMPAAAALDDKLPASIGGPALRAAAMAGDPAAAYEVAMRFAEGRGVAQSNAQAARWLDRAASRGLAPAQFRLGGLYEKGVGVKKDLAAALNLYRAAAEKGNGKAMHNLAVLYAEGVNGPPDYHSAAFWFRKAADHGMTDSQYNLGVLYARGIGVEQNYAESYKWFVLAADQGDKDAAKKRDEVASHLDQQSLNAARQAAQTWSPEPQPEDAISVKTPTAWDAPANGSHAAQLKPRPPGTKVLAPAGKPN